MIDEVVKEKDEAIVEKKKSPVKKAVVIGAGILVVVLLLASCIYFYLQYQKSQTLLKQPAQAGNEEVSQIMSKVAKHYDLPQNDQVTLATVSDIDKLKEQPFFAKAHNGDKVLIYPKSGLAILYRPTTDKIINVGPVDTDTGTEQASPSASQAIGVKIALYNGTQTVGLTKKVEASLQTLSSLKAEVVAKENSVNDYADSVVIDLTGKNQQAAIQLASFVKGKVVSLPQGEVKPQGADILIILGSSYAGTVTPTPTE